MAGWPRKPAEGMFEIPDLELKGPLAPKAPAAPQPAAARSGYDGGALDDDDMIVERNFMPEPVSVSMTRAKAPVLDLAASARSAGIELGHAMGEQVLRARSHDVPNPRRPLLPLIATGVAVLVGFTGVATLLARLVHRSVGWHLPSFLHEAMDAGSAIWSGSAAMGTLALTIVLAIMGAYARPRSGGYLLSCLGMLLVAISFIVITFEVGPDGPPDIPPDGARLIPWALPAVPLGIGVRLLRNAWDACAEENFVARVKGFALAGVAAGVLFAAVELAFGALAP